jgi:hypothetical protein
LARIPLATVTAHLACLDVEASVRKRRAKSKKKK